MFGFFSLFPFNFTQSKDFYLADDQKPGVQKKAHVAVY